LPFELLLDAADLLDDAARLSPSPDHAEGLAGIRERLEQFLSEAGLRRVARLDGPLDPRHFRVVGREDDGVRPRVVRAAILEGERLVREGEVILERER
jgi:molecular chaperone GrpE (heat shock protein)